MTQQIQLFTAPDGQVQLSVSMDNETVWLTQEQMGALFERERSVITKHIRNLFAEGELDEKSNVQNLHIAGSDKPVRFYNLDVIISVGYRVKSQRGVQFRQWATRTLKEYLVQGYTLNQRPLQERGIEFEQALNLLSRTLVNQQWVSANGVAVLGVIAEYARSWSLLQQYDEQSLTHQATPQTGMQALVLPEVLAGQRQYPGGTGVAGGRKSAGAKGTAGAPD